MPARPLPPDEALEGGGASGSCSAVGTPLLGVPEECTLWASAAGGSSAGGEDGGGGGGEGVARHERLMAALLSARDDAAPYLETLPARLGA